MQHLDEGTVHAWLDGALSRDEQILIEQHVAECAACVELVAEARGMIAGATRIVSALDGVPGGVIPSKRPAEPAVARRSAWRSLRLTPFRAGLAATVMIAAASMLAVRHDTTDKLVASAPDRRAPVVVPLASPAPVPAPVVVPIAAPPLVAASKKRPPDVELPAIQRRSEARMASEMVAASPGAAGLPAAANAARDEAVRSVDSLKAKAVSPAPSAQAPTVANEAKVSGTVSRAFSQTAGATPARLAQMVDASMSNSASTLFIGCYRIPRDSVVSLGPIPERFGLDRIGSPVAKDVVRAVGASGAMDSVLTSATWESTARGSATVTWVVGAVPEVLRVALTSEGLSATRTVDGRSQAVRIAKVGCSR